MNNREMDDRFEVVYKKGMFSTHKIIVDRQTGVQYLYWQEGYGAGLTVLVDRDGKPLTS